MELHDFWLTCYHEGGHVVPGFLSGTLAVDGVTVSVIPGGDFKGRCTCAYSDWQAPFLTDREIRANVVTLLAGGMAQEIIGQCSEEQRDHDMRFDLEQMHDFIGNLDDSKWPEHRRDALIIECWATARRIVRDWKQEIIAVARQLKRKRELTGKEVDSIITNHRTKRSQSPGTFNLRAACHAAWELGNTL